MLLGITIVILIAVRILITPALQRRRAARENRIMRDYVRRTY
jgi:hypothetical protein